MEDRSRDQVQLLHLQLMFTNSFLAAVYNLSSCVYFHHLANFLKENGFSSEYILLNVKLL